MCGIVAQFGILNKKFTENALSTIQHRGKTSSDFFISTQHDIFVGHQLLSLTGEINKQPFYSNNIIFAVNGEFYDYQNIQNKINKEKQLISDSELIVDVYQHNLLIDYLSKGYLQGEFAGIIVDKNINKALLFRDHFGIKPLYYQINKTTISVSSEIKTFSLNNPLDFDLDTVAEVLNIQYHHSSKTLFKNIFQVPLHTIIEIDLVTLDVKHINYFDFFKDFSVDPTLNKNDYIEMTQYYLNKAVKKRISNTKRKIGLTLSGGIDSSIIFSQAYHTADAYTIKFNNGGLFDESILAKELCDMYGKSLNIIDVKPMDLLNRFEEAIIQSEEVSINLHQAAKLILFEHMEKDNVKISLSGEGSDELFLGYEHFKKDLNISYSNSYLEGIQSSNKQNLSSEDLLNLNKSIGFIPDFLNVKFKIGNEIKNYLSLKNQFNISSFLNLYNLPSHIDNVYKSSYLWIDMCLSNYILVGLGDKMEMKSNIGGRTPFLDYDLAKFSKTIPIDLKIKNIEKYILRESYKDKLTENIYKKNKHPFIAPPLFSWSNEVSEFIINIIHNDISQLNFIDSKQVYLSFINKTLSEQAFFILWSLAIIYKKYIKEQIC